MSKWETLMGQPFKSTERCKIRKKCQDFEELGFFFTGHQSKILKSYLFEQQLITGSKNSEFLLFNIKTNILDHKFRPKVPDLLDFCIIHSPILKIIACTKVSIYLLNPFSQQHEIKIDTKEDCLSCLRVTKDERTLICAANTCLIVFDLPSFNQINKVQLHSFRITSLEICETSDLIFTSSVDKSVVLWNLKQNILIKKWFCSFDSIQKAKISKNLMILATLSWEGNFVIHNFVFHTEIMKYSDHKNPVNCFCISNKKGRFVYAGCVDGFIVRIRVKTKEMDCSDEQFGKASDIQIDPSDEFLVLCCFDFTVKIIGTNSLQIIKKLPGLVPLVSFLVFIPENNLIIAKDTNIIALYYTNTKIFQEFRTGHNLSCALTSNLKEFIVADSFIEIINSENLEVIRTISVYGNKISQMLLVSTSNLLIFSNNLNELLFWEYEKKIQTKSISFTQEPLVSLAFFSECRYLLTMQESGIWSVWKLERIVEEFPYKFHISQINCLKFSKTDNFCISGSNDCTIAKWDIKSHSLINFYEALSGITALDIHHNEQSFVSGHTDGSISNWSFSTSTRLSKHYIHTDEISCLQYLNSDTLLSGSKDTNVKIINSNDFSVLKTLKHSHHIFALHFSRNSKIFAVCFDKLIKVYQSHNTEKSLTLIGHISSVYCLGVYQNSERILSGSFDRTIKVWNLKTQKCEKTLTGHSACVWDLQIFSNEKNFFSCGWDNKAILWNLLSFQALHTLDFAKSPLWGVTISHSCTFAGFILDTRFQLINIQAKLDILLLKPNIQAL